MSSLTRIELSQQIINACLDMNRTGLNQGTAGNISHRFEDGLLVTPSGIPYEQLAVDDIVYVKNDGTFEDGKVPSSEWRFHHAVLAARPEFNAVVHTHAMYSTIVAIMNRDIPAIHYMIAAAGGNNIPCVPYATYGTPDLAELVQVGVKDRSAILLEHHGMIAAGESMAKAMWLATEVETLAQMYVNLLQAGEVRTLSDESITKVLEKFKNYGLREKE